jgi:protease II
LILNTDGQVAFDQIAGFYYTQVDAKGRGSRVFRHQVGTPHSQDNLIYDEIAEDTDYRVDVDNTLSQGFV